jgi:hypothetical protein
MNEKMTATFCKIAGIAALLFLAYSIITMIVLTLFGVTPKTAIECFEMLQNNRIVGLLRMDFLTILFIPLYYILFYGIYRAIKGENNPYATIALMCVFIGITLFLATPSVFSMVNLSDKYALATSETTRNQLIAAGESILASDMWHGSGAIIGSFLLQIGAVILSIAMLNGKVFSKFTGWLGIITHGLDLLHLIFLFIIPTIGVVLMAIAGTLYLLWLPFVGVRLIKLNQKTLEAI